jgi:hypothetical protein
MPRHRFYVDVYCQDADRPSRPDAQTLLVRMLGLNGARTDRIQVLDTKPRKALIPDPPAPEEES